MWYKHTMDYYSVIKKKARMSFATTWMNLGIITLSEESREETDTV